MRIDDTELPGLNETIGYIDAHNVNTTRHSWNGTIEGDEELWIIKCTTNHTG
jgi:hypothetical protein